MTLLKCNYLIFTNLSVIFIHFVIISKYMGKKKQVFTLFSITRPSLLQLIFGRLKKHASALAIQSNDKSQTLEWQVFSQGCWGLDLPTLYLRITFPMYSWCATRNPVPDSTYHLVDLKSVTTESWNVSPCMTATPWSRVNWKMCDENSTFGCFDAFCTQFSVTWPHCGTVHDFFWQFWLTALAVMNRIFHSKMAVTARAGGACTQFKTKHPSKLQRVLPAYMALHKIAG